ncbi:MAG TPA: hypothetical protein VK154_04115 [Chitinophagales bacterium]|nr:hypothetical protein [Chitinophagales bacterium]
MKKIILGLFLIFISFPSNAGWFDNVVSTFGNIANVAVQTVTAPVQSIVAAGNAAFNGGNPNDIYRPYQQIASSAGATIPQTVGIITQPENYLMQQAQQFASGVGGPTEFIFDIATFNQRLTNQLALAGANNINGILQGQNPFQIVAGPLAAAIRAARERHYPNSRPLPDDVKNALRGRFSESVLNRARYAVGSVEITLPNFIGQGKKFFANDGYAVVVDDIIVFNVNPGSYAQQPFWWCHEITHVRQYESMGIEMFAFNYLKDFGTSIERDADNNAQSITNTSQIYHAASTQNSYDMSGSAQMHQLGTAQETFVAQCHFPNDQFGVMYLVTNYGRIVAINPVDGQWIHIGYATPPRLPNVAWSYDLPNARWSYAVGNDGYIYNVTPVTNHFGQIINYNWTRVGHVQRLI